MSKISPPPVIEPLYKQIQRLKAEIKNSTTEILTLEDRLMKWIKSLSPAQLEKPYTTLEVIKLASLTGKHRRLPALQEVAQLLRKYGFEHKRSWVANTYNRRYWKFKK